MRQRAKNVGGALTIKSGASGTLVRMTVPAQTAGGQ
jgi:signal transduction histidine kinase